MVTPGCRQVNAYLLCAVSPRTKLEMERKRWARRGAGREVKKEVVMEGSLSFEEDVGVLEGTRRRAEM